MQPRLIAPVPAVSGSRHFCLTLPGMTGPNGGACSAGRYELTGFSGVSLTSAGALPLIVFSRDPDSQTAAFLDRLVNRSAFPTVTVQMYDLGPFPVRTQTFSSVTVDAVAFNDSTALIALRFASATDLIPSSPTPVSTPISVDTAALVEMDVSSARAPTGGPRGAFMRVNGFAGSSSRGGGWTDVSQMTVSATLGAGVPKFRIEVEKTADLSSGPLLGAAPLPDITWEVADGASFSRVRQTHHAADPVRRALSSSTPLTEAADFDLPSCDFRFSIINMSGIVTGSTLFTCP